jgi:glutamate formiminotransferase / 5-formyltetrahydrofolate cyclo-ligase
VLECVVNISEGRRPDVIDTVAAPADAEGALLDVHRDPDHHRSVLTVLGSSAPRSIAAAAVARLDLRTHDGVHPRIGVVDVVPFVPLGSTTPDEAREARDEFARWAGADLAVPCFLYGPERTLPDLRRQAWNGLTPDTGPPAPHETAGAMAVGVRAPLVAYNLWLRGSDLAVARRLAADLRSPAVRALGLAVGANVQVSMNLIDPLTTGPAAVYDRIAAVAAIERAELVGLVPAAVLDSIDEARWAQLDLAPERTIEGRAAKVGIALS